MAAKPFVPNTMGKRIATARRLYGARIGADILPPALAELLGVTSGSVYAWENDTSTPREDTLAKVARVLGVTPEWLRYGIQTATPIEDAQGETVRVVPSEKRQRLRGRG